MAIESSKDQFHRQILNYITQLLFNE